ncbi:unnamed protein product [Closterium sp. NIES-53]
MACADIVIRAQEKGWMDERLVQDWTTQVLIPFLKLLRDEGGWHKQALLVFDSYKGHLTESVGQTLKMFKVMRAVIPGSCTPLVQPLDVSINRSFKCAMHHCYITWFEEVKIGETTRNSKKPPPEVILKWIVESWADVPEELVKKSFLTCGISSAEDGSEDNLILAHLQDKAEVEVLEDVLEEEEDGAHPNPFYEDPSHALGPPATKDDEAEDEEEGLAGEEDVVDAAAEEGDGMAPDEEGGEADAEMGGADEWREDGGGWWAAGRYEGEEVEDPAARRPDAARPAAHAPPCWQPHRGPHRPTRAALLCAALLAAALPCPGSAPLFPSHVPPLPALRASLALTCCPALPAMAYLNVLTFDHEGCPIQFDTWLDDLQLYLLSDSRDSVSLFDHTSGASLAPPATADSATRSQWLTRDATARLGVRNHLPLAERAHFGQHKIAKAMYDDVVARYSSPATAALGRLILPYLFPELSAFATVEDLVTHLRTSDARYRSALPAEDHFLTLDPTYLTVDLLEKHLLAAETSVVAVGAARGTLRTTWSGSSPLLVSPPVAPDSPVAPPPWSPLRAMPSRHALPPPCFWPSQVSASPPALACPALLSLRQGAADRERYFLLLVDDYTRYTTVFPLRSKEVVSSPSTSCGTFVVGKGILHSFTLPASPQKNGVVERHISLVMEVARTSMIHVAAPHFLWPFAIRYTAHQLNLWPRGSRALVRDTFADKLSSRAIPGVFLGVSPDSHGWQFYHPTSRRVLPSQDVTFDESVPFYRPAPTGVSQVDPLLATMPVEVAVESGAARGAASGGVESEGAESGGAEPGGAEPGGTEREGAEPGGAECVGAESGGAELRGTAFAGGPAGASPRCTRLRSGAAGAGGSAAGGTGAGGAGATSLGGAGVTAGAGGTRGTGAAGPGGARTRGTGVAGPGGARTRGTGAAGAGGVGGTGAGDPRAGDTSAGAGGAGAGGTRAGGAGAGGARTGGPGAGGTGAGDSGAGDTGAGGAGAGGAGAGGAGAGGTGAGDHGAGGARAWGAGAGGTESPLPAPSPYADQTDSHSERREPASRPASRVHSVRTGRHVPRPRPPLVPGTHVMALHPSSIPLRVPLPSPPASSLPAVLDPESDIACAASPSVPRLLATVVTDPSFESTVASALVTELVDFAPACRLNYATSLLVECESYVLRPLGGDPDAPDIPTPRSYAEAITGPYSSQRLTAMDAEMASWKSTGTYVDAVPPSWANIVDGMWIFRVKRPPGSPPVFKARYVARGFRQPARGDLAVPPTWLHWVVSCRYPVEPPAASLCRAPHEWHNTLRTTLAALGFAPSNADPSLFLRTDNSLPSFYVLVYVDDLVFAAANTEALALVKLELQKRHTCIDRGELCSYLGVQITRDRARRTITLTQSHMVHQVLQRFGFQCSSPQSTPLPTGHSLLAPPSDESIDPSGPYTELVGCLMYLKTCTRPDLAYPLSILARYVAPRRHRPEHWEAAKRVLRYLCSTSGMRLGYTFSLGSGSFSWRSTRSSSVLSSNCEAEIYAGAMAAQKLRWLTYLLTNLGERPRSSPVLYVDNKAMIDLCQDHRLEHRTKHIALRYFLA